MNAIRWPLTYNIIRKGMLNHTFGMVRNGGTKPHQGWDFYAAPGTPCYAISDGQIVEAKDAGDFGLLIVMSFEFNNRKCFAAYAHLSKILVKKGENITKEHKIGLTGITGNAKSMKGDDQHLHFEIRKVAATGKGIKQHESPFIIYRKCPLKSPILDPIQHQNPSS
jgi:peptidoglycan LD-endopeptidase LytH